MENYKRYKIQCPNNIITYVLGYSKYHAIQIAVSKDNYKYSNIEYKILKH